MVKLKVFLIKLENNSPQNNDELLTKTGMGSFLPGTEITSL